MMNKNIVWSPFQKAIFEDIRNGSGNTVVIARAGAAKSTSLVEGIKYIPKGKKTIFVAFNKSIATELEEKINKSYIEVRTLHSKGFSTIKAAFGGKVALDPDKTFNITDLILKEKKLGKDKYDLIASIARTVNLCKGSLIDIPSKIDLLMDKFGIDTLDLEREEFIKVVCKVLRTCKEMKMVIDYTDMIWFPYVYGMPVEKYDRVFIDESQDLNKAQVHLATSLCKKNGRILACGDDKQVLYSFASVELDTMDKLIAKLNAKVLPLSISYRCAKNIVKLAQEIVPDIQAADGAKEGIIKHIPEKEFLLQAKPGDFILSRVNAPLIYYCMSLLRMGVPANIQGKDVGGNLAYMIKKSEAKNVPDFLKWLADWKASEIARLRAKSRDPILIIDKAACLETLCEGVKSLDEVIYNIKALFNDGDDASRVILSSTHKAKGLERERVFLLTWTYRKNMNEEESNIYYVAITRAKSMLFLVEK